MVDNGSDFRRDAGFKRKLDSLERDTDTLHTLMETLYAGDKQELLRLLCVIRSNTSHEEIRAYIANSATTSCAISKTVLDEVKSVLRRADGAKRHRESDTGKPRWAVPARPWTHLTTNKEFVSHLVSLWFDYVYPLFVWVDRELFIRDMQSGRINSDFCSPVLVNVILADACVGYQFLAP